MGIRDTGTEQLIKDTSKYLFFVKGNFLAITQDIAQAAGVNRTSLNYYFRSRDVLIEKVFNEAILDFYKRFNEVLASKLGFKEKVENLIDVFLAEASARPFQEAFIINKMNCESAGFPVNIKLDNIEGFVAEMENEMEEGHIEKMKPIHFIINLFALINYPLMVSPLYKQLFDFTDEKFDMLVSERKSIIIKMIFK